MSSTDDRRGARTTPEDIVDALLGVPSWLERKVEELGAKMGMPVRRSGTAKLFARVGDLKLHFDDVHDLMEATGVATAVECARRAREAGAAPDLVADILRVAGNPARHL